MKTRVLTGITTSGIPHLGNYAGAIRPCIEASRRENVDGFFFMADYHALVKCADPARIERSRLAIAATWLAAGLDPTKNTFYRQSDIPEIPELNWMLACVTAKGLLNRAHAYKAAMDQNTANGEDADAGVTAGLYMYPVLMAADILAFKANQVPVGRDQIQHLEMARDIAQRFNHLYGGDYLVLPEVSIEAEVATLPGLDGRKMSKSYDNTIPLFEGGAKALREGVMRIVTDSKLPGEPKEAESSALYAIFRAVATTDESVAFRLALEDGLGWGEAKQRLYELLESQLGPMRERYEALLAKPEVIEEILQEGAGKARAIATPLLATMRDVVGLRRMTTPVPSPVVKPALKSDKPPRLVSFRDHDGRFRFRLFAGDGEELLLSIAYTTPKGASLAQQNLRSADTGWSIQPDNNRLALLLENEIIGHSPAYANTETCTKAERKLRETLQQLVA